MVSTSVIHINTWITAHLPTTDYEGMEG